MFICVETISLTPFTEAKYRTNTQTTVIDWYSWLNQLVGVHLSLTTFSNALFICMSISLNFSRNFHSGRPVWELQGTFLKWSKRSVIVKMKDDWWAQKFFEFSPCEACEKGMSCSGEPNDSNSSSFKIHIPGVILWNLTMLVSMEPLEEYNSHFPPFRSKPSDLALSLLLLNYC